MQKQLIQGRRLIDNLLRTTPLWVLGTEESGLRTSFIRTLAARSGENPFCGPIALSAALWHWQRTPLDRHAADMLDGLARQLPLPAPKAAQPLQALRRTLGRATPPDKNETAALIDLMAEDHAQGLRLLLPLLRGPSALHWLAATFDTLQRLPGPDAAEAALDTVQWPDELIPLKARLQAECAILHYSASQALEAVLGLDQGVWSHWQQCMLSELLLRNGDRQQAVERLSHTWRALPWHIGLGLKLRTLLHPAPDATQAVQQGTACILLYSWNKADLVDRTLASLSESGCRGARLFVLDNGSTDHMQDVLRKWREAMGRDHMHVTTLPVNVGAPAARNWLLSLPEVRSHDWAAFLDDDVILPHGWLERLLANALHGTGRVGTVGCRIISASGPDSLQSADYNIFPPQAGTKTFRDMEENLLVHDNCAGALDLGLFSYTRPALSVSGCCHLLNLRALDDVGGFDIRFSPTQFDDLERDLRTALSGLRTIYAGELAIRHVQHSSLARAQSMGSMAQVFGNKIKLEGKYDHKTLDSLSESMLRTLWDDAGDCWETLDSEVTRR